MNSDEARSFIKKEKRKLLAYFIPEHVLAPEEDPILICMAGSSGAGKTETATVLMERWFKDNIIRIDADDIKSWLVGECGGNLNNYHSAAALGVDKIYDECLRQKKNCIIDGTFVDLDISLKNINRAFDKGYSVVIVYVYQDPEPAWYFVKEREKKTGRKVPFSVFKNSFVSSIENVWEVKNALGSRVSVFAIKKNFDFSVEEFKLNADESFLLKMLKSVKMKKLSKN